MSVPTSQPVVIPLQPSTPWYRVTVTITGTPYHFDVRWNVRDHAWYFDVYESDETPIAYGLKIVLGTNIGRRVKHPLFAEGAFRAADLTGKHLDAGFDDIGTRVQLRYFTAYDIISAIATANGQG